MFGDKWYASLSKISEDAKERKITKEKIANRHHATKFYDKIIKRLNDEESVLSTFLVSRAKHGETQVEFYPIMFLAVLLTVKYYKYWKAALAEKEYVNDLFKNHPIAMNMDIQITKYKNNDCLIFKWNKPQHQ